jgi:hypothetical protein
VNKLLNIYKKIIVDHIYYNIGGQYTNFRLCYANKNRRFSKWIPYLEAQSQDWFINKCNQREILKQEIVLDLDDGTYQDYLNLIKKLHIDGFKFHAFATKSGRCRHIHFYDDRLPKYNEVKKKKIKERIINMYGCDNQLKIDSHMIPIEFCKHWKTGEIKNLIFTNRGDWYGV